MYDRYCRGLSAADVAKRLADKVPHTVRMKIPEATTHFEDLVRKTITVNNNFIDDQILLKSDGWPTYHLASVVDDHLMEISHVIRGDEWLPSTAKHVILYKAFGWEAPQFAHVPLLLNPDKTKLSKRQGDVSVDQYIDKLYLPEAVVNFVAMLGWSPVGTQEIFSLEELIAEFSVERMNKAGAIVDPKKLLWFNAQHIRKKATSDAASLLPLVKPLLSQAIPLVADFSDEYISTALRLSCDRVEQIAEFPDCAALFFTDPVLEKEKAESLASAAVANGILEELRKSEFKQKQLAQVIRKYANDHGLAQPDVYHFLRYSLTGCLEGPSVVDTMCALGKETTLARVSNYCGLFG